MSKLMAFGVNPHNAGVTWSRDELGGVFEDEEVGAVGAPSETSRSCSARLSYPNPAGDGSACLEHSIGFVDETMRVVRYVYRIDINSVVCFIDPIDRLGSLQRVRSASTPCFSWSLTISDHFLATVT